MGSLDIPVSKKIPAVLKDPGAQPPARQGHGEDRQGVPIRPGHYNRLVPTSAEIQWQDRVPNRVSRCSEKMED
jgi:hypothetical protein